MLDAEGKRDLTEAVGAIIACVIVVVLVVVGLIKFAEWVF